ncbi:hypothetical protein JW823_04520 [bacterium]|nr:hypothetical protein [candidate division CSSED10-310 bacterium]
MEQKVRILKMVEEGKITSEEAVKLLEAMDETLDRQPSPSQVLKPKKFMRFLKIRIFEGDLDKPKVRVALPIALLKLATKFIPEDAKAEINGRNIDLDEILRAVDENTEGKLLEVHDDEEKTRIEIFID